MWTSSIERFPSPENHTHAIAKYLQFKDNPLPYFVDVTTVMWGHTLNFI